MILKEINKTLYRKRLKVVFVAIALALMAISVPISTLLIYLFSTPEASHFFHNLAGVAAAAIIVYMLLNKFRHHPYLLEVVYVWDLKQALNRISRKLRKIEAAVENNNKHAMIIMNFMHRGSKQLYQLDDNLITMDTLLLNINTLDQRMKDAGLSLSTDAYNPTMLDPF